jgi:hypothetical protein
MTLAQRMKHRRADIRVQAKREAEMMARLQAELPAKAWWVG